MKSILSIYLHQGAGVSFELCVVVGTINDPLHLIHVSLPVYLRV